MLLGIVTAICDRAVLSNVRVVEMFGTSKWSMNSVQQGHDSSYLVFTAKGKELRDSHTVTAIDTKAFFSEEETDINRHSKHSHSNKEECIRMLHEIGIC